MNIALWIVAGLLTLVFLAAGTAKVAGSREQLMEKMSFVASTPQGAVKLLGVAEILGALGLVLPALVGVLPILVPVAAIALVALMIGAVVVHLRSGEGLSAAAPSIVLALLAAFVAWGRLGAYAF
ncbi:DoxX family protein [Sanguibacter antarcticus]|uniref:DoxX-like protein n=1 Tax=Sanguibacter antarcticus TaxID=372484 RepID=A0A2A9E5A8_9MICO|nr:DoxX family protein [Sanguibacter antarcticus]PFG34237.1 DoxX-like protein [Sanguibacter antarcticus]